MLVAAKVDAEHPHRAAKIINSHPGVSHNYLRTHEFNLWFTIATPPDSELGLQGTLDVLQRLTGAESIRQLPTLTLFKINMNLEMEKGTEALAAVVEAARRASSSAQPYDELDVAVIRALQGPMEVVDRPYDEAAAEVGMTSPTSSATSSGWSSASSCAASPRSSSTAAPASPPTAWASGRCPTRRSPTSAGGWPSVRGISHCYERPTYEDWPYSVFTMAHGRSKEECDAVLAVDRRRARPPRRRPRDPLLLAPSSRRSACATSRTTTPSGKRRTRRAGAVDAAVADALRARRGPAARAASTRPSARWARSAATTIFIERGAGCELIDVDGNRYVDWVCSWGPLILGHAHPAWSRRSPRPPRAGPASAPRPRARSSSPSEIADRFDVGRDGAHGQLGDRGDDERDPPRPRGDRPREAAQVRRRLPRPRRRPARRGRLGPRDAGDPGQPRASPPRRPRRR